MKLIEFISANALSTPAAAVASGLDYGIIVVIAAIAAFCLTVPLRLKAEKNAKKKVEVEPLKQEIRKKYGINKLGASVLEDIENPSEEIAAMTNDEREQKAAEEIDEMYRREGYQFWTAWVPGVAEIAILILFYFCVPLACPEGPYKLSVFKELFSGEVSGKILAAYIGYGVSEICTIAVNFITADKQQHKIVTAITSAIALALAVWIAWRASPAVIIGLGTIRACTAVYRLIRWLQTSRRNKHDKDNHNYVGQGGT